jgi:hypothetical protein
LPERAASKISASSGATCASGRPRTSTSDRPVSRSAERLSIEIPPSAFTPITPALAPASTAAALEPNIEEHQIGPARHYGGKRLVAVAGRAGAMALVLKNARDQLADIRLIVDDQDIGCHVAASVAFLMIFVSACEISRRSKRAGIDSDSSSTSKSMSG